jgi:hypothetical protein
MTETRAGRTNRRSSSGAHLKGVDPEIEHIGPHGEVALHALAGEIQENWTKLNDKDLAGVSSRSELLEVVQRRYRLTAGDALEQVELWARDRNF